MLDPARAGQPIIVRQSSPGVLFATGGTPLSWSLIDVELMFTVFDHLTDRQTSRADVA